MNENDERAKGKEERRLQERGGTTGERERRWHLRQKKGKKLAFILSNFCQSCVIKLKNHADSEY